MSSSPAPVPVYGAAGGRSPSIVSPAYRRVTVGMVSLVFLLAFEAMAVGTAMPVVVRALDGLGWYAWAFSGFMAASMLATVISGELTDRGGPLMPLVAGVATFTLGLFVGGVAPSMLVFVVGRVLQGIGAGASVVAVMVVIARVFPSELRPSAFGAMSAAWVVPAIIGPSIAGTVAEHLTWRLVFLGLLPLVIFPTVLILPRVRALSAPAAPRNVGCSGVESDAMGDARRPSRIPLAVAAAIGIGGLQYAGQHLRWWSLAFALPSLVLVVFSLPRLLPAGTLRFARGLPSVVRMRGVLAGSFGGAAAFLPLMLVEHHGVSATLAGIALTVGSLGWSIGAWLQARPRLGFQRVRLIQVGAGMVTTSLLLLCGVLGPGVPWWLGPTAWALAGLGMGLAMTSVAVLLFEYSPDEEQGGNSAAMQLSDSVGNVTMVGLGGVIFAGLHGVVGGAWPFGLIFGLLALNTALGVLTAERLRRPAG